LLDQQKSLKLAEWLAQNATGRVLLAGSGPTKLLDLLIWLNYVRRLTGAQTYL